jgi:peptidoglycan/xylan/chitin deacetylase (PgdA/CDA1 family)
VPILMYHRVAPDGMPATRRWRLHPDAFEAQLRHLRDRGYRSLTLEQWGIAAERRQPVPARSVAITFDDGYADFAAYALPLLRRYGFGATLFVVSDLVGATNAWDERLGESIPLMDWPELAALQEEGIELGSHSSLHRSLVALSPDELAHDLCRSRLRFHEQVGRTVRSISYPFGHHDARVLSIAGACGFHHGVTVRPWHANHGEDLLRLPRIEVHGTDTLSDFARRLVG